MSLYVLNITLRPPTTITLGNNVHPVPEYSDHDPVRAVRCSQMALADDASDSKGPAMRTECDSVSAQRRNAPLAPAVEASSANIPGRPCNTAKSSPLAIWCRSDLKWSSAVSEPECNAKTPTGICSPPGGWKVMIQYSVFIRRSLRSEIRT
jgi:hypothetical protein